MELTRRNFVQGAVAGIAGLAALGATGCAAPRSGSGSKEASSSTSSSASSGYADKVSETKDFDIVIVGAGMSGLAAAVEALSGGANVAVLESQSQPGGNGNMTSCITGVGSDMQKEAGIDLTPAQIIKLEMETFNYGVDGARWASIIHNSVANIEWLKEQGVTISVVDDYHGSGKYKTAHEWDPEAGRTGGQFYVTPMVAKVEELGGEVLCSTPARELIVDDSGAVTGVYAEGKDGVIQFNAKAVILATGGYANSTEILQSRGYDPDKCVAYAAPGHEGDGINMAIAAGGKSWLNNSSLMDYPINPELGTESNCISAVHSSIWVNGDGVRFTDENNDAAIPARAAYSIHVQDASYALFDQTQMDAAIEAAAMNIFVGEDTAKMIEDAVDAGSIFKGDTLADVAEQAGINAETLQKTVDDYNAFCAAGSDDDFGKDAQFLQALTTPPYYLSDNSGITFLTTIGGIDTTPTCEVRAEAGGVVPGLFAVGVDGVENYRGIYTIDIPGSCNANNVYTGRTAAQQALKLL